VGTLMEKLDSLIFPGDQCEAIILTQKPKNLSTTFGYTSNIPPHPAWDNYTGEAYIIFAFGIEGVIKAKELSIMLSLEREKLSEIKDFSNHVFIAISSHEVRHRVWQHFPDKRLDPYSIAREPPSLQAILRKIYTDIRMGDVPQKRFEKEFDATVVEYFVSQIYRKERMSAEKEKDMKKIAQIVQSGPQEIFKMRV